MGRSIRRRQIHAVEEFVEIQFSFGGEIQNFCVILIGVSFKELVVENEASDIGFVTKIIMRLQYMVYNT